MSIDAEGVPHRVVSSDIANDSPALRAVIEAAEGWRYTPALFDGAPALSDAFLELECDPVPVPVTHSSVTIQAGKDIPMPAVVSAAQPDYTEEAYSAKVEGHAQFAVTIDTTGRVTNVASLFMIRHGLDQNAMDSILRWRFRPPMKEGIPVTAFARMQTTFRIEPQAAPKQ